MADLLDVLGLALFLVGVVVAAAWAWLSDRAEARRALRELQRIEACWAEDLRAASCRRWSRSRRQRRPHG